MVVHTSVWGWVYKMGARHVGLGEKGDVSMAPRALLTLLWRTARGGLVGDPRAPSLLPLVLCREYPLSFPVPLSVVDSCPIALTPLARCTLPSSTPLLLLLSRPITTCLREAPTWSATPLVVVPPCSLELTWQWTAPPSIITWYWSRRAPSQLPSLAAVAPLRCSQWGGTAATSPLLNQPS